MRSYETTYSLVYTATRSSADWATFSVASVVYAATRLVALVSANATTDIAVDRALESL